MSDEKKSSEIPAETDAADENAGAANGEAETADASGWAGGDEAERVAAVIEALQAENNELKDRHLRAVAEMENLRRRTDKEVRDASQYGIAKFARDVLSIGDNLQRAIEAVPPDDQDPGLKALLEGVQMTERELLNVLQRHGIERFEPMGERFDPNQHQAMMEVPDPSVPNGTVVQVMQTGYRIGERVLRPALVGVAKGGPKQAVPAPEAESVASAPEQGGPAEPEPAQETGQSGAGEEPGGSVNRTA